MFGVLLLLVLAVVFAEIADGGIDSKALAMLGVLSAVNAGLRPLGAGTAGIETMFFVLDLRGPGVRARLRLHARLHVAVRVGVDHRRGRTVDAVPDVRLRVGRARRRAAAAVPRARPRSAMLAAYGVVAGYFFGFMLNLQFWPFSVDPGSSIAYLPGASVVEPAAPLPRVRRHDVARLGHRPRRSPTSSASC